MNTKKKLLSLVLALILALSVCVIAPVTASAEGIEIAESAEVIEIAESAEDIELSESAEDIELAESGAQTINVTSSQISSRGFRRAVQDALDQANSKATDSNPVTVNVAAGTFTNDGVSLKMYSNTTLDLRGVTVKRASSGGNVIRVGSEEYDVYSG